MKHFEYVVLICAECLGAVYTVSTVTHSGSCFSYLLQKQTPFSLGALNVGESQFIYTETGMGEMSHKLCVDMTESIREETLQKKLGCGLEHHPVLFLNLVSYMFKHQLNFGCSTSAPDGLLHQTIVGNCLEKGSHFQKIQAGDWMNHSPVTVYQRRTSTSHIDELFNSQTLTESSFYPEILLFVPPCG